MSKSEKPPPTLRDMIRFFRKGNWTYREIWSEAWPFLIAGLLTIAGVTAHVVVKEIFRHK